MKNENDKILSCLEKVWSHLGQTQDSNLVTQPDPEQQLWETSIGVTFVEDAETVIIPVDFEVQSTDYPETAPRYLSSIWSLFEVAAITTESLDTLDSFNAEPGIKLRFEVIEGQPTSLVLQCDLPLSLLTASESAFEASLSESMERLFAFVEEHYPQLQQDLVRPAN